MIEYFCILMQPIQGLLIQNQVDQSQRSLHLHLHLKHCSYHHLIQPHPPQLELIIWATTAVSEGCEGCLPNKPLCSKHPHIHG